MAVNVYVLGRQRGQNPQLHEVGAIGSGRSVSVRGNAEQLIRTPGHVLIAEGVASRTRRWNPTFNWQVQGGFKHRLAYPTTDETPDAAAENALSIEQYLQRHQNALLQMLDAG